MYIVNIIYNPHEYIDYETLNQLKIKAKKDREVQKKDTQLSRKYYKELCHDGNLKKMKLMFYSEQSGFYKYFENIIEAILKKTDEPIYYIQVTRTIRSLTKRTRRLSHIISAETS